MVGEDAFVFEFFGVTDSFGAEVCVPLVKVFGEGEGVAAAADVGSCLGHADFAVEAGFGFFEAGFGLVGGVACACDAFAGEGVEGVGDVFGCLVEGGGFE